MTKAVYDFLEGKKEIMHMSHYQFAAKDKGDIDGVVVGELSGRKHVVLCEAKHNVTAQIKNAKRELLKAKYRWDELCDISMEYEELSSIDQEDIDALRIREFRSCSVIFAVGGTNFPENGIALKQPWIAVPLTDNRSGSAVFMKV